MAASTGTKTQPRRPRSPRSPPRSAPSHRSPRDQPSATPGKSVPPAATRGRGTPGMLALGDGTWRPRRTRSGPNAERGCRRPPALQGEPRTAGRSAKLPRLRSDVDDLEQDVVRRAEHDLVVGLPLALGELRAMARRSEERGHVLPLQEGRDRVDVLLLLGAHAEVIHAQLIVVRRPLSGRRGEPERPLALDAHAEHVLVLVPALPAEEREELLVEGAIRRLDVDLEMVPR